MRKLEIVCPNQLWATDITYIAMKKGFMYLTASIDLFSRKIMAWELSTTLAADCCIETLEKVIEDHGVPEIVNSDQGSQFACGDWIAKFIDLDTKITMDGKGRALVNDYIERSWRTLKQSYLYLHPEENWIYLFLGIATFMEKYNKKRHQGIGRVSPNEKYKSAA